MIEQVNRKEAAEKLASLIQKLAEEGKIDTLSITFKGWSSDELFKLASSVGIKEISAAAIFGS